MVEIRKIIWDEWNIQHIARHDVKASEVEIALKDTKVKFKQAHNGRLMALGRAGRRLFAIILAPEGQGEYYVITARDMDKQERRIYRGD